MESKETTDLYTDNHSDDAKRIGELLRDVLRTQTDAKLMRMGSMTNRTYRADLEDGRTVIVRLPGDGTQEMIDRADERNSTVLANRLGLDAQLLYFGENGEKVTAYIPDAVTMSPETMRSGQRIRQAAQMLRTLHACGEDVGYAFDVFALADLYETVALRHGISLFPQFRSAKDAVLRIQREQTDVSGETRVFCHNDPIYANWLLDQNEKMYLIDWEYAGMNDPLWDLADLSIESDFLPCHDEMLLTAYLQREPDSHTVRRFLANKIYVDYVWSLWAKAREPFEEDWIIEYGNIRYARMQRQIEAYGQQR